SVRPLRPSSPAGPNCALACWPIEPGRKPPMVRLVSDENFNGDIVRGLLRRRPDLDLVRVQDVGLSETPDPEILEWAAGQERVLLSHDVSTVPPAAYQRTANGKPLPGVFIVPDR